MKTVTLISKDDCRLCEVAKEVLRKVQEDFTFHLEEKKIVPGSADFEQYHERVPVILIDGDFAFQYRISERQMLEKLKN